jgi:hypothetical protein
MSIGGFYKCTFPLSKVSETSLCMKDSGQGKHFAVPASIHNQPDGSVLAYALRAVALWAIDAVRPPSALESERPIGTYDLFGRGYPIHQIAQIGQRAFPQRDL